MTIAPTGSGKGTGCVIPTLLDYPGSVVVFDPKGENYIITARQRQQYGRVILLDPFAVTEHPSDTLNPVDLLKGSISGAADEAMMLAEMISPKKTALADPFWDEMSRHLIAALIAFGTRESPHALDLEIVRMNLQKSWDDMTHLLWEMKFGTRLPRDVGRAVLNAEAKVRASIITTAQQKFLFASSPQAGKALAKSSFPIDILTRGEPVSIYIVIPPEKLSSHNTLLRLWVATLMTTVYRRKQRPQLPTLLLLDEAAQLGTMPLLRDAITLMRGYGLQTWTFWQDISQLKQLYPRDWETLVNNADILQVFGLRNMRMAKDITALTGYPDTDRLFQMNRHEQLLTISGDHPCIAELPDYRRNQNYQGRFDKNRFYS